jgi:Flp pilus assembly pilin Flp
MINKTKQRGQGMTEYIIIVALITIAAIAAFSYFGQTVRAQTGGMAQEVAGQSAQAAVDKAKEAAGAA